MATTKKGTIGDILTTAEFRKAVKLYRSTEPHEFVRVLAETIITPALPRINAKLGQENDARYLAYMIQYILNTYPPPLNENDN